MRKVSRPRRAAAIGGLRRCVPFSSARVRQAPPRDVVVDRTVERTRANVNPCHSCHAFWLDTSTVAAAMVADNSRDDYGIARTFRLDKRRSRW